MRNVTCREARTVGRTDTKTGEVTVHAIDC
jgi:hypothetical protein